MGALELMGKEILFLFGMAEKGRYRCVALGYYCVAVTKYCR